MIKRWTKFEGSPNGMRRGEPRVTMHKVKTILLNKVMFEAIGSPAAVEMYFDAPRNMIGLKPADKNLRSAFPVKPKGNGTHRLIAAGAFCTHFGIKVEGTILFQRPFIDRDGTLELDLTKTTTIGRGAR
jgi:hypothetical protein